MTDVYIGNAKRTPISQLNGTRGNLSPVEFVSAMIFNRVNNIDSSAFDEVIIGQVISGGAGQNLAHQTSLNAELLVQSLALMVN